MQLFITDFKIKWDNAFVENKEILDQIRKVLRLKIWDKIFIQNLIADKRYEIQIVNWDDKNLEWKIIQTLIYKLKEEWIRWMIVCMPNKWDKIELITQKLTEIWMDEIAFWPSERSIIKEWNQKKEERLNKIIKEAVEQSRSWKFPEIKFVNNIREIIWDWELIVFDKEDKKLQDFKTTKFQDGNHEKIYGLVWPEWWLSNKDYGNLQWIDYKIEDLWENILRTETAAIVAWWEIKKLVI